MPKSVSSPSQQELPSMSSIDLERNNNEQSDVLSYKKRQNSTTTLQKCMRLCCYFSLFACGVLVGFTFNYLKPMFSAQNQVPPPNITNTNCIPPLTKSKFYEFGVELALGEAEIKKQPQKWKLRKEYDGAEMDYRVYTHTINDYNYAIAGWFRFDVPPQALSDTYFQRKLQQKWDYIGTIKTLKSGEPKSVDNLQPYNGTRTNPETLYVQSALPIIQDTDKVLTRGTEMFRDPKTDKSLIVSVSRDVGAQTYKLVKVNDKYTRTMDLDVALVISSTTDPNTSEFFAYIRESTTFTVPEWVIAYTVPLTIPEYFSNFYKIAKEHVDSPVEGASSQLNYFDPKYRSKYENIRKWKPSVLHQVDPEEQIFAACNKDQTPKRKINSTMSEPTSKPGMMDFFGNFLDNIEPVTTSLPSNNLSTIADFIEDKVEKLF